VGGRPLAGLAALAAAGCLAAGCTPAERGVVQGRTGAAVISLSEGPCEDACPVYDMTLRPDGSYTLHGEAFVRTTGIAEGALGPEAWTAAEEALEDADFWRAEPDQTSRRLPNCMPGAPTVRITWRTAEGKEKTLTYDAGCGVERTRSLIAGLRAALAFDDLVWTDERFRYAPPGQ
jgi:hypothetical protein